MDRFVATLEYRSVLLTSVADVVQFSNIVQKSISHLDLKLYQHCAVEDSTRTLSYSCMRSSVNDFISTEEKYRKILTPSRSLLYTLHLDLPKGREHYLKEAAGSFSTNFRIPHIGKIHFGSGFYFGIISGLIYHAVNFAGQRCKTFNWLSKFKVIKESEFHRLHPIIVIDFLNDLPFFNMDPTVLKEFFTKFCFKPWMFQYENAVVLEYFLHHASFFGRDFEKDRPSNYDLTDACISKGFFLNIAPILKCIDTPRLSSSYGAYLFIPEYIRRGLTEEALTQAGSWMTKERKKLILQLLVIYLKALSDGRCVASAFQALHLLWNSLPAPFISYNEISMIFGELLDPVEIQDMYWFYSQAVGEFNESVQPRSLKHSCRTIIRKAIYNQRQWIAYGVDKLLIPRELKSFLKLDMRF